MGWGWLCKFCGRGNKTLWKGGIYNHIKLYLHLPHKQTLWIYPVYPHNPSPSLQTRANPLTLDLLHRILLEQQLERKRLKRHALAHEMLAHGLHPMQP